MRTTLNIDDKLLAKASKLTEIKEKTSLVRLGLETLIKRESSKRLAELERDRKKIKIDTPSKNRWFLKSCMSGRHP